MFKYIVKSPPFLLPPQSQQFGIKGEKTVVCIHPWWEGFVHLPDFIYRCRLILSLDGHRD